MASINRPDSCCRDIWYIQLRPEGGGGGGGGGGVKVDFPVFTHLIRAAGDELEEKNRTEKTAPNIEVYM